MPARICPNCGEKNYGEICTRCGQTLPAGMGAGSTSLTPPPPPPPPPPPKGFSGGPIIPTSPPSPPPVTVVTPISPTGRGRTEVIAPPNPLPPDLARKASPLVEGKVIDVNNIDIEDKSLNAGCAAKTTLGLIMLPFNFIAGVLTLLGIIDRPKQTRRVMIARLRTPSLDEYEVRIEKDLKAATFGIGDYISVWGLEKDGVYYLHHGYNHRTRGRIELR
jgi:hypothetical protein